MRDAHGAVLALRWEQVDLDASTIALAPGYDRRDLRSCGGAQRHDAASGLRRVVELKRERIDLGPWRLAA